jgi:hypothetical protein
MTVSDLLEQSCNKSGNINKVVTSSANTTCLRFVDRLATRCEIFACVKCNICQCWERSALRSAI